MCVSRQSNGEENPSRYYYRWNWLGQRLSLWSVVRRLAWAGTAANKLGRISRCGYAYLRNVLVQAALRQLPDKANRLQRWIVDVYGRAGYRKT